MHKPQVPLPVFILAAVILKFPLLAPWLCSSQACSLLTVGPSLCLWLPFEFSCTSSFFPFLFPLHIPLAFCRSLFLLSSSVWKNYGLEITLSPFLLGIDLKVCHFGWSLDSQVSSSFFPCRSATQCWISTSLWPLFLYLLGFCSPSCIIFKLIWELFSNPLA